MIVLRRPWRHTILVALLLAATLLPAGAAAAAPAGVRVVGDSVLSPAEVARWFTQRTAVPFRLSDSSVTPRQLVDLYFAEANREGLAPDLMFVQAAHETAFFSFPAGGCVQPKHNNFAGMGAYDCHLKDADGNPVNVWRFRSIRDGVRAHVQYLRAYADPTARSASDLSTPIVTAANTDKSFANQWNWVVNTYRWNNGGPWETWERYGKGVWAADPDYWDKIWAHYERALLDNGYSAETALATTDWYLRFVNRAGKADLALRYGRAGDVPLACDWNGDGVDTPGKFRRGRWTLSDRVNGGGALRSFTYGTVGDLPLCGDWNGDGRDTVGIVRDRTWHLKDSLSGGAADRSFVYGRTSSGDRPIVGDWNRNGRDTVGIVRDRQWHLRNTLSGGTSHVSFTYGRMTAGDLPLVGDWDGDGRDTAGIVRGDQWYLRNSLSAGPAHLGFVFGKVSSGDVPVTGDWTGNGVSTPGVIR